MDPPKRALELKNNDSGKTGHIPPSGGPPPPTQQCLINFIPIVQTKGEGVKGFFRETVELVKSVSLIDQRIIAFPYLIVKKCQKTAALVYTVQKSHLLEGGGRQTVNTRSTFGDALKYFGYNGTNELCGRSMTSKLSVHEPHGLFHF